MSLPIDVQREAQQVKFDKALVAAVEFELEGSISHSGGVLSGISVKFSGALALVR